MEGALTGKIWKTEEDEALCKAIQKFKPGYSEENKELEPGITSRSIVQMKDKVRLGILDLLFWTLLSMFMKGYSLPAVKKMKYY